MSIIKNTILFLSLTLCFFAYAQESKNQKTTIFVDFNDQKTGEYSINNDTTSASFVIYIEKYQTKEARDKATTTYYNDPIDRNSVGIPSFSVNLYSFNSKPTKLKYLDCIKYMTVNQFIKKGYKTTSPTYVIHKLKDGTYLKWKTFTMN
ncbi:hypothetical protein [Flavobacterium sp. 120]|uniref:hypothetical protein n=1 Tax=Flavobacterium sp. 120 TaxID=2135626 RepID=UPI000EB276E3|nr:hypothetical protein [Flavobacterium sp. 120]RKS15788.1 hypothetical protein C8C87_3151 [Flavobacterium sp. 120]